MQTPRRRTRLRRLEPDVRAEAPCVFRPVDADVVRPRLDAKRVEETMVIVRVAVALVDRDVELVRPFDELEAIDRERGGRLAGDLLRVHLLEIRVCTVAADAVRVEDADAEHEIIRG